MGEHLDHADLLDRISRALHAGNHDQATHNLLMECEMALDSPPVKAGPRVMTARPNVYTEVLLAAAKRYGNGMVENDRYWRERKSSDPNSLPHNWRDLQDDLHRAARTYAGKLRAKAKRQESKS
jgi:hypothetical protein